MLHLSRAKCVKNLSKTFCCEGFYKGVNQTPAFTECLSVYEIPYEVDVFPRLKREFRDICGYYLVDYRSVESLWGACG